MKAIPWTLEEVSRVLDDKEEKKTLATEISRKVGSLWLIKYQYKNWQAGKKVGSANLEKLFEEYSGKTGKSNTVLVSDKDTCMSEIEKISKELDSSILDIENLVIHMTARMLEHKEHALVREVHELRKWKQDTEKELSELKTEKDSVQNKSISGRIQNMLTLSR